jgi:anti-sigma-K factor RskA
MSAMTQSAREREEIEGLLPWHAAGTLSRGNAGRVGRALAGDGELAQRFERVREELAETIHLNESLGVPSTRAMQKLFAAIDAEGATRRKPGFARALRTRAAEMLAGLTPRALALACVAALALVVAQAGIIGDVVLNDSKLFHVAEAHHVSALPRSATDVDLLVTFAPQAALAAVDEFMSAHGAKIVYGPQGQGTYRVRFANHGRSKDDVARLVAETEQNRNLIVSAYSAGD